MPLDFIKEFNWVDIFVVILLFRISYISLKNGFPIAFFKLLGTVAAIYLALHYYTTLSDLILKRFSAEKIPLEFLDFLFFIALAMLGYLIFVLLRIVFYHFIKMEAASNLNRWGGLLLGLGRGALLSGLIIFIFAISTVGYLRSSVDRSYLGRRLFKVAPETYSLIWNAVSSKFMVNEKFNATIIDVENNFLKK